MFPVACMASAVLDGKPAPLCLRSDANSYYCMFDCALNFKAFPGCPPLFRFIKDYNC
jgi:hypothetical protein